MCAALLFCAFLGGPAHAYFELKGGSVESSFTDLGAQGFGNDPRLLTLQGADPEGGQVVLNSSGVPSSASYLTLNNVVTPGPNSDKNSAPSLFALGWSSGANVQIGLNLDEAGNTTGIFLTDMVLSVYNSSNVVAGTFSLPTPALFLPADMALQQGNGNAVFDFVLSSEEQTAFDTLISGADLTKWHVALAARLANTTDGPDSFIAIPGPGNQVPEPVTLLLLGSSLLGVAVVARKRIKK